MKHVRAPSKTFPASHAHFRTPCYRLSHSFLLPSITRSSLERCSRRLPAEETSLSPPSPPLMGQLFQIGFWAPTTPTDVASRICSTSLFSCAPLTPSPLHGRPADYTTMNERCHVSSNRNSFLILPTSAPFFLASSERFRLPVRRIASRPDYFSKHSLPGQGGIFPFVLA